MSDETEISTPKKRRVLTDEQKAKARENMAKARASKLERRYVEPYKARAKAAKAESFAETFAEKLTISSDVEEMLRGKAREAILEEKRAKLEALRYEELLEEERAKYEPQEERTKFMIVTPDAIPNVDYDVKVLRIPTVNIIDPLGAQVGVRINNKLFVTDREYEEKRSLFAMIAHSCFCAMKVERAVGNPNRDFAVHTTVDMRLGTPIVNTRSSILG